MGANKRNGPRGRQFGKRSALPHIPCHQLLLSFCFSPEAQGTTRARQTTINFHLDPALGGAQHGAPDR